MTTDSMGAEKYNTHSADMSFSKSTRNNTRNNSQHTFSTSPGSENFIVNHMYLKKSNSLNEDECCCEELLLDENYLQYHKDRPSPL